MTIDLAPAEELSLAATEEQRCCAACRSAVLRPHLGVSGDAGADGLIPTNDRFGSALADLVRCPACSHVQLQRFPQDAKLREAYFEAASDAYIEEEAGQRATAREALERIERHVSRGALLDLGCWVGFLLAEARARGWATHGVEPSEFASAYAREQLGLDVENADLFGADLPQAAYDAVVLGDVIEHLPHPADALDRVASLLRPGGVVYMTLPDAGSRVARMLGSRWWSVIPTHVQYFSRHSLITLLRRRGYEPLAVATAPKVFTVRYYLTRIGGYSPGLSQALVRSAERVGADERLWGPDFRDRMAMVARPLDRQ